MDYLFSLFKKVAMAVPEKCRLHLFEQWPEAAYRKQGLPEGLV